jgi:CheY-like chemotaxis protein
MTRLLVVEDLPKDLRVASEAAVMAGISLIESKTSASAAKIFLEAALRGQADLPDAIVLDLDLGFDSGFELMRFWHSTPRLRSIPVIVWTELDDQFGKLCDLFKVAEVVPKWQGRDGLLQALSKIAATV